MVRCPAECLPGSAQAGQWAAREEAVSAADPVLPLSQLPTRILAETVRILVGTVCRNFDVASNGGSQPSNGITQPSGGAFPRLLKTHMISIASRADGLSGWPHIYAACTPFYIGLWPRRRADPACPTPRKRCMTCWQLGPAECERSDFALWAQVAPNLEPQMRSQF